MVKSQELFTLIMSESVSSPLTLSADSIGLEPIELKADVTLTAVCIVPQLDIGIILNE
jgi:hypothetical protein